MTGPRLGFFKWICLNLRGLSYFLTASLIALVATCGFLYSHPIIGVISSVVFVLFFVAMTIAYRAALKVQAAISFGTA